MPTELLTSGFPIVLKTNVVYALPHYKAEIYSSDATPTLEQSNVFDFATKSTLTFTSGVASASGLFLRATAGTPTIVIKRA